MNPTPLPAPSIPPGDGYVQSFARGLAVIRSFSAEAPAQTLSEVAQRAGLTRAGARRILLTLQTLGYVESEGRLFRLTPKILDLGFAYLSSLPLWQRAEPVMQALVAEVHESCSAAVLDGPDIVYVLRVPTHKIMSINLGIGSRLPAYCTSMGRVLLADLGQEERERRLALRPPQALTSHTLTDAQAIAASIDAVRREGYSLVDQELEEGLVSMAVAIRDRSGRAVAALNISGQANRTPPAMMREQLLPKLQAAAGEIARLLAA
ncbi:IclR family transcriptional regulator domain-containing protein [Aquabacterium sp.]|uniref:IclR family transcriptional regulator domain-containing protein n=1 Tax=Aquabacterium sp. TaxID=1872578 RepID=UPI002C20F449|nr:IclR family transcriptional regulator C-terminal domain-containing protein [Aquabacterium sp.]HSW05585.1 IclR family transcriptional regulator C-terminal domain-containing protein [Aquabacterium sp.]